MNKVIDKSEKEILLRILNWFFEYENEQDFRDSEYHLYMWQNFASESEAISNTVEFDNEDCKEIEDTVGRCFSRGKVHLLVLGKTPAPGVGFPFRFLNTVSFIHQNGNILKLTSGIESDTLEIEVKFNRVDAERVKKFITLIQ